MNISEAEAMDAEDKREFERANDALTEAIANCARISERGLPKTEDEKLHVSDCKRIS
jgi:hypothetical protein